MTQGGANLAEITGLSNDAIIESFDEPLTKQQVSAIAGLFIKKILIKNAINYHLINPFRKKIGFYRGEIVCRKQIENNLLPTNKQDFNTSKKFQTLLKEGASLKAHCAVKIELPTNLLFLLRKWLCRHRASRIQARHDEL